MREKLLSFYLPLLLYLSFVASACGAEKSTRLAGEFQSYQTIAEARDMLAKAGIKDGWKENIQKTGSTDQRPPYEILYMAGPFKLLDIEGRLRLTFYNGWLTETQFSTLKGREFIKALRARNVQIPEKSGAEILTDVRTKFRFDSDPGQMTRFTWYDPKLEEEWNRWVAEHS